MKDKISKKIFQYTTVFEPAKEGDYIVTVPVLPGYATQRDTFEKAKMMIQDAIQGYISVLR